MTQGRAYADLEIRILDLQDEGYPVEITVNGEGEYLRGYLKPDVLPWVSSALPNEDGERLFELLFADGRLKSTWAEIRGRHPQCRIRLRVDPSAPQLHAVPWELLRETSPGHPSRYLAATTATPFSRYIAGQWVPGEPVTERPIKVLVAIANPKDLAAYSLEPIDSETEGGNIADAFSDLTKGHVKLTFLREPVTLPRLEDKLREGFHVLHIVAHGMFKKEAVLFLADDGQRVKRESDERLAAMIDRGSHKPHLVFLASCQSASRDTSDAFRGFAPKLIMAGVPVVLAMQDFVPIGTSRAFTHTFYRRLFEHGQVDLASNEARSALLTEDIPGGSIPVLFSRLPNNQLIAQLPGAVVEREPFEPETVYIRAGPFLMGSLPGEGIPERETPQHQVDLPAYRIGKYPVTNVQYEAFVEKTGRQIDPAAKWEGNRPQEDRRHHPVMGVSWYEALAYCQWLSEQTGRDYSLPSEEQWEKAARGTDGRIFPWGNEWDPNCCNHGSSETAPVIAFPKSAVPYFPEGGSPFGCYDMVGNVREWTSTIWGEDRFEPDPQFSYPRTSDSRRDDLEASPHLFRVYRGGASTDDIKQLRCSARNAYDPRKVGPPGRRHGFRVVLNIEGG